MNIDDNGVERREPRASSSRSIRTVTATRSVSLQPAGTNVFPNFTTDLDIPFRQDSFDLTQVAAVRRSGRQAA